ncbi:hypothetical protein Leryth_004309 [Lithospermum erythrorhizon]|nr:hypothetical protein Leryth_004309 [Lithospermum erythrorhizon]
MENLWSWISELPYSDEWTESNAPLIYPIATSKLHSQSKNINNNNYQTGTIQLKAERTIDEPNSESFLKFSICLLGFKTSTNNEDDSLTLWVSETCPLTSEKPFLPFIMQLLQETISLSPTAQSSSICPRSQLKKLKPEPVSWILDSHSPESFSTLFNLIFLTRLFFLCSFEAPLPEAGSFFFNTMLPPNMETFSCNKTLPILRTFFMSVGTDVEMSIMRTFGYMLTKWLIFKDVGLGLLPMLTPSNNDNYSSTLGFLYAAESHGLWILKGYVPVKAAKLTASFNGFHGNNKIQPFVIGARESVLKYALSHQMLEAVIQLEYSVEFFDGFIHVKARVDNIRLHVMTLGLQEGDGLLAEERYFPSKIRVWVGPEMGADYVGGLSLGLSTNNLEKEMESERIMKGDFGSKIPDVKIMARMGTKTKVKNWRWDQDAEGNTVIFDSIMYDNASGMEVATWDPSKSNGGHGDNQLATNLRRRYSGANRGFTKKGGLVFAREEFGEGVGWRLNKEMEGSVLKWRIGAQVCLTYWPNDVNCSYYETRCIDWCDEVDLPLIPTKSSTTKSIDIE